MTYPDDAELLPCPFCGKKPEVFPSGDGSGTMIECVTQKCVNPHTSWYGTNVAKSVWNRRTPSPLLSPIKAFLASIEHAYVNMDGVSKEKWDELQRVLREVENG